MAEGSTFIRRPRVAVDGAIEEPGRFARDGVLRVGPAGDTAIVAQRDGTEKLVPNPQDQTQFAAGLTPVQQDRTLDSSSAMQIGLYSMLRNMRAWRIGLDDLMREGDLQASSFELARVFFDWPRQEDAIDPMPSATITLPEEEVYGHQGIGGGVILEETADQWGPGTILKKTAHATTTLNLVIWSAHKEERRGLKKALQRVFLTEPHEEMSGRRVVVPQYFDRVARFELLGIRYDDGQESAQSNEWILVARFAADIDVVDLVTRPPYMQQPAIAVTATSAPDDC